VDVDVKYLAFSERLQLEVFKQPAVRYIRPRQIALDGTVGDCLDCDQSFNDGKTVSIWVSDFPELETLANVSVSTISNGVKSPCALSGTVCTVRGFENLAGELYLAVSPGLQAVAGEVHLEITFLGAGPPPAGVSLLDDYTRSPKTVSGTLFYYKPNPEISDFKRCAGCGNDNTKICFENGVCGDGKAPVEPAGADISIGTTGGGALILTVLNAQNLITLTSTLKLSFGIHIFDAVVKRIAGKQATIQLNLPALTETPGPKTGTLQ
jgi:hypothetical protein